MYILCRGSDIILDIHRFQHSIISKEFQNLHSRVSCQVWFLALSRPSPRRGIRAANGSRGYSSSCDLGCGDCLPIGIVSLVTDTGAISREYQLQERLGAPGGSGSCLTPGSVSYWAPKPSQRIRLREQQLSKGAWTSWATPSTSVTVWMGLE